MALTILLTGASWESGEGSSLFASTWLHAKSVGHTVGTWCGWAVLLREPAVGSAAAPPSPSAAARRRRESEWIWPSASLRSSGVLLVAGTDVAAEVRPAGRYRQTYLKPLPRVFSLGLGVARVRLRNQAEHSPGGAPKPALGLKQRLPQKSGKVGPRESVRVSLARLAKFGP